MGYDIIIMAGQSNAVGFGFGDTEYPFIQNPNITHLIDTYPIKFITEEGKPSVLDMPFPPSLLFEEAKEIYAYDRFNGNIANSFATEYIKSGRLQAGRKILIVKAAVGGTGFLRRHWTRGGVCYEKLFYMVDEALRIAGEDSKIVAFLWHQGEHDAFENSIADTERAVKYNFELDSVKRKNNYYSNLITLLTDVRKRYADHDFPIIAGEFVREWIETMKEECNAILSATKDALRDIGNAALASSEGLTSNGRKNGTADILHFSKEALAIFGKRYFEEYEKLVK